MLASIKLLKNHVFGMKTSKFCHLLHNVIVNLIKTRHHVINWGNYEWEIFL